MWTHQFPDMHVLLWYLRENFVNLPYLVLHLGGYLFSIKTTPETTWSMGIWGKCFGLLLVFMTEGSDPSYMDFMNDKNHSTMSNMMKYLCLLRSFALFCLEYFFYLIQGSPFCKYVREVLVELELPHIVRR